MKRFLLTLLLFMPSIALAQAYEAPLGVMKGKESYPAIEFMSAAESSSLPLTSDSESLPSAIPQSETLRVVVYRSEIYQSLVIEAITTGLGKV